VRRRDSAVSNFCGLILRDAVARLHRMRDCERA
jgi:hypothetical protein